MSIADLKPEQILIAPDAPKIGVHVDQAKQWLATYRSAPSQMSLLYAAIELRLEIERLAIEVFRVVGTSRLERSEFHDSIGSFDGIEAKIYAAQGRQREIDKKIEFLNLFERAIGGDRVYPSLQVGQLKRMWHEVSEYCHVAWTLRFNQLPLQAKVIRMLEANTSRVDDLVRAKPGWIEFVGADVPDLMRRFLDEQIDAANVICEIQLMGITTTTMAYDANGKIMPAVGESQHQA